MTTTSTRNDQQGFTLIELLIVIAIIGFLAGAVLVAVDPVKRIQGARDARRFAESNAVLNAILTKQVDDRALLYGLASAPIVNSQTLAQVIVLSDEGVECDTAATAPDCPAVTLSVATGKACVANLGGQLNGTFTIDAVNDQLDTGLSTDFVTEVAVGDEIAIDNGETCTVESITSAVILDCDEDLTGTLAGHTGTNVTDAIIPTYIAEIPVDPRGDGEIPTAGNLALGDMNSGYYIKRTNGNRIEIGSCYPEDTVTNPTISVKR